MILTCGKRSLDLSSPVVMGILNVTADSFSDGGRYFRGNKLDLDLAVQRAGEMLEEGAAIIDVGGESTRPGAEPVSVDEELQRVIPVVEAIAREFDAIVSVDTSSPAVMREAAAAGGGMINDVRALQREGAIDAVAEIRLPVCLMHMQGEPGTMQENPHYDDVVPEVSQFLADRVGACTTAGIQRDSILLDPGFGFGKTLVHNLTLLRELGSLTALGFPVLVGLSRKSLLAKLLNRPLEQRLPGSLALAMLAAQRGARVVRAHDVAATRDVLQILRAIEDNAPPV